MTARRRRWEIGTALVVLISAALVVLTITYNPTIPTPPPADRWWACTADTIEQAPTPAACLNTEGEPTP